MAFENGKQNNHYHHRTLLVQIVLLKLFEDKKII